MNYKKTIVIISFVVIMFGVAFFSQEDQAVSWYESQYLPRPIAQEMALITSVGQGSEIYIIKDIANKLMLHNYFVPQARELDLDDVETVIFVVSYSRLNESLYQINYQEEIKRVEDLIKLAGEKNKKIITLFLEKGSPRDNSAFTNELVSASDYIIAMKDSKDKSYIYQEAQSKSIPITLVESIGQISEPLIAAFR